MREDFLHFIWQHQYFKKADLKTSQGEDLVILHPGYVNKNAGPDFSMARLKINNIEWHGHVEIHIKSSHWNLHAHQYDKAYDNVILHVVWKEDNILKHVDHSPVPTLVLHDKVDQEMWGRMVEFVARKTNIPCKDQFMQVEAVSRISMFDKALAQRLQRKAMQVKEMLIQNQYDWEQTAYQLICKNFGFQVNTEAFFTLSKNLPVKLLLKHSNQIMQLEALLLGQAGLLDQYFVDEYPNQLKKEYLYLSSKYDLYNFRMNKSSWKFSKLRPPNFPTIRLAELAAFLSTHQSIFSMLSEFRDVQNLMTKLQVQVSLYWQNHYVFDKVTSRGTARIGRASIENIIINSVVPLLACLSREKSSDQHMDHAIHLLENLPPEENNITSLWKSLGVEIKNAFDSQSVIEMYQYYCREKQCLRCVVGTSLLASDYNQLPRSIEG